MDRLVEDPNMKNTIDITNLSNAALDAVLDVRSGVDNVDASNLTISERYSVADALGWEMNARTRAWCENAPYSSVRANYRSRAANVEEMILADQDAADFGEYA